MDGVTRSGVVTDEVSRTHPRQHRNPVPAKPDTPAAATTSSSELTTAPPAPAPATPATAVPARRSSRRRAIWRFSSLSFNGGHTFRSDLRRQLAHVSDASPSRQHDTIDAPASARMLPVPPPSIRFVRRPEPFGETHRRLHPRRRRESLSGIARSGARSPHGSPGLTTRASPTRPRLTLGMIMPAGRAGDASAHADERCL